MRTDKELARKHGISSAERRYAARYGDGVEALLQTHKKNPVGMLDHWQERAHKMGGSREFPFGSRLAP